MLICATSAALSRSVNYCPPAPAGAVTALTTPSAFPILGAYRIPAISNPGFKIASRCELSCSYRQLPNDQYKFFYEGYDRATRLMMTDNFGGLVSDFSKLLNAAYEKRDGDDESQFIFEGFLKRLEGTSFFDLLEGEQSSVDGIPPLLSHIYRLKSPQDAFNLLQRLLPPQLTSHDRAARFAELVESSPLNLKLKIKLKGLIWMEVIAKLPKDASTLALIKNDIIQTCASFSFHAPDPETVAAHYQVVRKLSLFMNGAGKEAVAAFEENIKRAFPKASFYKGHLLFGTYKEFFRVETHIKLTSEQMIEGNVYPKGSEVFIYGARNEGENPAYFSERFSGVKLSKDTTIQGHVWKAKTCIQFHPNGKISRATLAHPQRVDSYLCKDVVEFDIHGHVAKVMLAEVQTVQSFPCTVGEIRRSNIGNMYTMNGLVEFSSRLLSKFTLSEGRFIQGLRIQAGSWVTFYANGQVGSVILTGPATLNGITYTNGLLSINELGRVVSGILLEDTLIDGLLCAAGTEIRYNRKGKIKSATLAASISGSRNGYRLAPGEIQFRENGDIRQGNIYSDPSGDDGTLVSYIEFSEDGVSLGATISRAETINGILFPANSFVQRDKDNRIEGVRLSEAIIINNITCPADSMVFFDKEGAAESLVLDREGMEVVIDDITFDTGSTVPLTVPLN